jgi:hypothetical protein
VMRMNRAIRYELSLVDKGEPLMEWCCNCQQYVTVYEKNWCSAHEEYFYTQKDCTKCNMTLNTTRRKTDVNKSGLNVYFKGGGKN